MEPNMVSVVYNHSEIDFAKPGKHHYQLAFHLDSNWGYSLVPLTVINGLKGVAAKNVVAIGGTHGNEYEGQVAVKRLCQDLEPEEMSGRVILLPQLSESACGANLRESPLDHVNMNRAFPGNPRGTISYRISNFIKTTIFPQVHVVLDIHSGGNEAIFALCTSFHPISDPSQRAEIAKVAQLFDTPFVMLYSSQMASGLLTDEAEALGKITVGGEFGFAESTNRKGTLHAYEGIRNVLRHYRLLPGEIVKIDLSRPSTPRFVQAVNLEDYIPCPKNGIWEPTVDLGVDVKEGDLLGRLHDFSDHSSEPLEIRSHRSGVVLVLHFTAQCRKGATLYVIAQEVQL
jgi:N2-acetyl-L-2,4-diaminobutanoate deacetylase